MPVRKDPVHLDASATIPTLSRLGDHDMTVSSPDEDIRGRTVKDKDGQDVGKIDGLLVDDAGHKVWFIEVATGGFLGLGETKCLIPIEAITRITADEVHISHTREHVAGAPRYDPQLTAMEGASYRAGLHSYYSFGGGPAPWVTTWPTGQHGGGRSG